MIKKKMKLPNVSLKLSVSVTKQGRDFVAYSPALDISTVGKSIQDAQKKFEELSSVFLEEIVNAGTFETVLSELGWKKNQQTFVPPEVVANKSIELKIPVAV